MKRDPVEAERKMRLHIGHARVYVEEQMRKRPSGSNPGCRPGAKTEDRDQLVRKAGRAAHWRDDSPRFAALLRSTPG